MALAGPLMNSHPSSYKTSQLASNSTSNRKIKPSDQDEVMETRLKGIIEVWQKKFYEEYVQPSIQSQFNNL